MIGTSSPSTTPSAREEYARGRLAPPPPSLPPAQDALLCAAVTFALSEAIVVAAVHTHDGCVLLSGAADGRYTVEAPVGVAAASSGANGTITDGAASAASAGNGTSAVSGLSNGGAGSASSTAQGLRDLQKLLEVCTASPGGSAVLALGSAADVAGIGAAIGSARVRGTRPE